MPRYYLTTFDIQRYYQNETKFKDVYSRFFKIFFIGFITFMLNNKRLTDFTHLFSSNNSKQTMK